ncbi:group III truncated hemoglobin [Paracoccus zeaxanthinifaciens]|uniref:group III truncated hemoglobin n=1 Tax=Paracoccus zeaxanthinifaciens TaxID=187400 RepID=UPI0003B4CB28|nr:group III truncated hemoglobin [Paracoccus zeaxanthinifaciens]
MDSIAPARFDVTEAEIARVVATFYAAVRRHPVLAPVFTEHVGDWSAHEDRIAAFWRGAILHRAGYNGSPMRAHQSAGNVRPEHFDIWLQLFDQALEKTLPPWTARAWSQMAHRIGQGLRAGVQNMDAGRSGPPVLR